MSDVIDVANEGFENAREIDQLTLVWRHPLPDGREATIYEFMFNARLCVGPPNSGSYDDGYCYHNVGAAVVNTAAWVAAGGEGEPAGWRKNLQTGAYADV